MHKAGVVSFPGDSRATVGDGGIDAGDLGFFFEIEDTMKDRMLNRQVHDLAVRENPLDFIEYIFPFALSPEIVEHDEAAVE